MRIENKRLTDSNPENEPKTNPFNVWEFRNFGKRGEPETETRDPISNYHLTSRSVNSGFLQRRACAASAGVCKRKNPAARHRPCNW